MNTDLTPDQLAAHRFVTELRTRITTQRLAYQHGIETRALESVFEIFGHAREAIKDHPGCETFAREVTKLLNLKLRPFTAKWHKAKEAGRLNSLDGADDFRGELELLRVELRAETRRFHEMAYGHPAEDPEAEPVVSDEELKSVFEPLAFGVRGEQAGAVMAEKINASEVAEVSARRKHHGIATADGMDAVGLAFSGGGIRSATFCLGVAQVLADKGLLRQVDFLSTVSGGGYTGSFLTARLGAGAEEKDVAGPHGPDPLPVREIRRRAKYLMAYSLWESWGMVTATVAGMVFNWIVPLVLLLVLAALASLGNPGGAAWMITTIAGGVAVVVAALAYFGAMRTSERAAKTAGWAFTLFTMLTALAGIGWALDAGFATIFRASHATTWATPGKMWNDLWDRLSGWGIGTLSIGSIAALVPVVLRYIPLLEKPATRKLVTKVALWIAGFVLPLLGLALFYLLCAMGRVEKVDLGFVVMPGRCLLWCSAGICTVLAAAFLNINLTGPHRLYRNGLNKTFVQKEEAREERVPLTDINPRQTAPYHLLNAAVNIPSCKQPGLRDRHCDFFLFSKHWMGSPITGYRPAAEWQMNGQPADLGSALAISGAAFSANMGLGTYPTLRALLVFLNVRLGFWIRQPHIAGKWGFPKWKHPGFFCLLREMTGLGMREDHRWLNLSDGGHIENMAVYELLRRRCKFIICVDGEADPQHTFQGLMTLVRHAQIDFGIRIEPHLDDLRPHKDTGMCRSHFQRLCRIHYPEGTGLLLYLKLSLTGNEAELIRRYRHNNADFPHQTTLDQFFDEEQFEAYRQLGVHVTEGLFSPALMNNQPAPADIPEWFRRLAGNLLEPAS